MRVLPTGAKKAQRKELDTSISIFPNAANSAAASAGLGAQQLAGHNAGAISLS
jgi:hypothetical protein